MVAAAEPLAAGDAALQGLIADIRAGCLKGVAAGPVYRIAGIAPGTEAQIEELSFRERRLCRGLCRGRLGRQP